MVIEIYTKHSEFAPRKRGADFTFFAHEGAKGAVIARGVAMILAERERGQCSRTGGPGIRRVFSTRFSPRF